jgi:hypothetical protein
MGVRTIFLLEKFEYVMRRAAPLKIKRSFRKF